MPPGKKRQGEGASTAQRPKCRRGGLGGRHAPAIETSDPGTPLPNDDDDHHHRHQEEEEDHQCLELKENEELSLEGVARVRVSEGCLLVGGYLLAPDKGSVTLCGNVSVGWPLRCRPVFRGEYKGPGRPERCVVSLEDVGRDRVSGIAYTPGSTSRSTYQHRVLKAGGAGSSPSSSSSPGGWGDCLKEVAAELSEGCETSESLADFTALVCGPKNAGKSTFCRELVNTLLNSNPVVAYLETDCGQPEFSPPGSVSLTFVASPIAGPPFMHPRKPERACFVGDTTPKSDPVLYFNSVVHLMDWYAAHGLGALRSRNLAPLVVNTPGWVKGLGFEILDRMVRQIQPKHVVQLCTNTGKDLPREQADWRGLGLSLYYPPAHEHNAPSGVSAVDMRSLMWLSFCHQCAGTGTPMDLSATTQELFSQAASSLCGCLPYRVNLDLLKVVSASTFEFPSRMLPGVLNGSLVGLAEGSGGGEDEDSGATTCYPFVGFGLVRSVDPGSGDIFVLTNAKLADLRRVGALVLGSVQLPQQLLQNEAYQSPYVAQGTLTGDGIGAGVIKGRNNMRRGRLST
ncbi:polynucleotide 5'-hydroxyl-kinase [Chloropicon primus]|uniref:Polynucleotide 5'-hydroxyl-kinase n=1 Tax=Chloropicon primus TaxID=1764295 RepID=A0A5B8MJS2_9CHLO|nr:polynucleotide 5'-hydroxyl-kinase [Chloropicon primus]UPQ99925.1 polynucleotide 5'-hydroxyl-kinase [Chloropicon primus]|eukprot:QDZ20713.1 polynucleotide 5'-hydroxyl-kinase [Chloropicon primus]